LAFFDAVRLPLESGATIFDEKEETDVELIEESVLDVVGVDVVGADGLILDIHKTFLKKNACCLLYRNI
jgi:hypothetical protein